ENYIKRCIGIPGDSISIENAQVYVNGEKAPIFDYQNLQYRVFNITLPSDRVMYNKYKLLKNRDYYNNGQIMNLTAKELEIFQTTNEKINNLSYYPKSFNQSNTVTNFDSYSVPKKGATIELTPYNVDWYKRVITAYEHHTFTEKEGVYFIDGKEATEYTFEMN